MYDAVTDAAVKLAEVARMAPLVCESAAALGGSLLMLQTVGHPRLTSCTRLCFLPCPSVLAQSDSVHAYAGGPGAARVRTLLTDCERSLVCRTASSSDRQGTRCTQ